MADGKIAHNIIDKQLCHEQAAISPIESPLIEIFCDNGPLTGNQMRFVLSTNGAQLVLCDVHVYGGNAYSAEQYIADKMNSILSGPTDDTNLPSYPLF